MSVFHYSEKIFQVVIILECSIQITVLASTPRRVQWCKFQHKNANLSDQYLDIVNSTFNNNFITTSSQRRFQNPLLAVNYFEKTFYLRYFNLGLWMCYKLTVRRLIFVKINCFVDEISEILPLLTRSAKIWPREMCVFSLCAKKSIQFFFQNFYLV